MNTREQTRADDSTGGTSLLRRLLALLGAKGPPPLGRVLVKEKVITTGQLVKALDIQKNDPQRLGQIIVEQGFASEVSILQAIAAAYGVTADSLKEDISEQIRTSADGLAGKIFHPRMPIRVKLSVAITFIIWLTILSLSFVILARQKASLYEQTVRTGKVSLNYFVNDAAVPLIEDDLVRLNALIKEADSVEGLLYAAIVGREGTLKAHSDASMLGAEFLNLPGEEDATVEGDMSYFRSRLPSGEHALVLAKPVMFDDVALGKAFVGISLAFIDGNIRRESINVILLSVLVVFLGIFIALQIGAGFSRPLCRLVDATHEIGKGNFQHRIRKISKDEFGDLAAAFNYMSLELWKKLKMQQSFGSYVSPEILEMVMAQPEDDWLKGQRMSVTVLFTDIRGFTNYSENNEPEKVVETVNRYFQIATRHIQEHGGYIDKFIGDAVLGVFGAPVARDDHAARAVRTAWAMQEEFRREAGKDTLLDQVGIGINTGEAVAGDLGSKVKKEYSVIGDCVNLASRLNHFAGPGEIIISRAVYEAAGSILEVRELGPVKVKGKDRAIDTFAVTGIREGQPLRQESRG